MENRREGTDVENRRETCGMRCETTDSRFEASDKRQGGERAQISRLTSDVPRLTSAPLVSVIIPTIGGQRLAYLEAAIASVQAQTLGEWEMIVVGDGADEATCAAVERHAQADPRIRYLAQPRSGVSTARNNAIRASNGRYIAFLDDDDLWYPEKLAEQTAVMEADARLGLVAAYVVIRNEETGRNESLSPKYHPPLPEGCTYRNLVWGNFLPLSSVMVRRSVLDLSGMFDPGMSPSGTSRAEDYDLWLRIARVAGYTFLPVPLGINRRHGSNISAEPEGWLLGDLMALSHLAPDPALGLTRRFYGRCVASRHYLLALEYLEADDWARACRHLAQALRHNPIVGVDMDKGRNGLLPAWRRVVKPYRLLASHWVGMKFKRETRDVRRQTRSGGRGRTGGRSGREEQT